MKLQLDLGPEIEITDFYFDQQLLVLKIRDQVTKFETLKCYIYYQDNYIFLKNISTGFYRNSILFVDDRESNLKKY